MDVAKEEDSKLTKSDIIWGGANDINRDVPGKGLTHTVSFLRRNQKTNVIISVPFRFDRTRSQILVRTEGIITGN
jgi:hypothetical protein